MILSLIAIMIEPELALRYNQGIVSFDRVLIGPRSAETTNDQRVAMPTR